MNNEDYLARMREAVLAADERHRHASPVATIDPRRHPRWLAAAAVLLLAIGMVVVVRPNTAAAGVEVVADSSGLTVRLTDLANRPEDIERAARDAGLDVDVVAQPVGPSMVGKFLGLSGTELVEGIRAIEGDPSSGYRAFRVPLDYPGQIVVRMGRAAAAGEEWASASDATGPGELLACQDLVGQPLAEVYSSAEDAGATSVRVMLLDDGTWLSDADRSEHPDAVALQITSDADGSVEIFATDDVARWSQPPRDPARSC